MSAPPGVRPRAVLLALAALGLGACGAHHHPPAPVVPVAAEPAVAPVTGHPAAGRIVDVGRFPEGIVADGNTELVAVGVRDPAQVVLLDAHTGRVVRRVRIRGAPRHLQLASPGGPVLVPEEPADRLLELSLPSGEFRSIRVGAHPHDATEVLGQVFVNNEFGQSVSVIDGSRVARQIGSFRQPGGLVAVGSDIAVVDVRGNSVTLIDARSLRIRARLGAGAGPTHAVAGPGGHLYVVDTRGGAVFTYTTRPALRLISRFALSGTPYGIAIDPSRSRLWVTLTARNELVELATGGSALRTAGAYATDRQPNTVAVDPRTGRVFVANADAGTVQLIDPVR